MKRILVIEDESGIRENIKEILSLEGFYVITAPDGSVGVELAKEEHPDLILSDIRMPELDGFGVLKALHQNSLTSNIPIIFLSAKASHDDLRQGMELGADDYLTKPFTASELLKAIAARFEKQEAINRESAAKLASLQHNIARSLPHEMLTALNGILGMSDLLLTDYESFSPEEVVEAIRGIHDSGETLHRLVQNVLLLFKLDSIAVSFQAGENNLDRTAVKNIIGSVAHSCAEKVSRETDLELDLEDAIVNISPEYLAKAVEEIVGNAFKFSQAGTAVRLFSKVDEQFFKLYISDRGRGLTTEQIANIGAYMQFDRKRYEQQGNGLGLIIAKRIVELYGGEFSVENSISNQTIVCMALQLICE